MAWTRYTTVPFGVLTGNMHRVVQDEDQDDYSVLLEVDPMECSLQFVGFEHHSITTTCIFEDSDGKTYPMFIRDFQRLVLNHPLDKGKTPVLEWAYTRKGLAYGIRYAGD